MADTKSMAISSALGYEVDTDKFLVMLQPDLERERKTLLDLAANRAARLRRLGNTLKTHPGAFLPANYELVLLNLEQTVQTHRLVQEAGGPVDDRDSTRQIANALGHALFETEGML